VAGVDVQLLHPCNQPRLYYPEFSFNDNSLVLKFTYGGKSVLLPGDLSLAGETHLLARQPNLKIDLLKLGHHGSASASSADFLQATHPAVAIASCGFYNSYQFPSDSVRERLRQRKIRLFRTDIHGWIRAKILDSKIKIVTQKDLR
jgi:competence protein ComEC